MSWKDRRDRILFWGGLSIIAVSVTLWVVFRRSPDPQLMLIAGGMIGVTAVLKNDEGKP